MAKSKSKYQEKNLLSSRFFLFYGSLWILFILLQGGFRILIAQSYAEMNIFELWSAGLPQDISWSSYGILLLLIPALADWKIVESISLFIWLNISIYSNIADSFLLQKWGSRINAQALFYLTNVTEAFASLSTIEWFLIIVFIPVNSIICFWGYLNYIKSNRFEFKIIPVLLTISILLVSARGGLGKSPLTIENAMRFNQNMKNQIALNSSWNFIYSVIQGNQIPDVSHFTDLSFFNVKVSNELFPKTHTSIDTIVKSQPNVLLIVLEGVSAELSRFFHGQEGSVTPNLDLIASEGLAFTNAYATGDRTDKGLVSIFSGWPGQPWQGILAFPEKAKSLPNIFSDFNDLGYHTSFYYGSDLHFANQQFYLEQADVDEIFDVDKLSKREKFKKGSWGIQDADMFKLFANDFLENTVKQTPYFSALLTLSTHDPYDAVPGNTGKEKEKMIRTVKYLDHELMKFFNLIKKSEQYKNTLIVIVSDHGKYLETANTNFGQRNFFHIPIIFTGGALPLKFRNTVLKNTVSQTDIYSTLFHLLGWTKQELLDNHKFKKGNRELLKYSRSAIDSQHPQFAWFNIPGVTGIINNETAFWLATDKLSIELEKPLNKQDSSILNLSTTIVNDFFMIK